MIYITDFRIHKGVLKKVIYNVQNDNGEEETIIVPESVKEIVDDAFNLDYNSSNVVSIHLPKTVEKFSATAFSTYRLDFPKLTSIEVDPENPCYQSIDGVLYNKTGKALIHCPRGRTSLHIPKSVTSIGEYAFLNCTALTEIVFPSRLKTIGYAAFNDCRSLQNLAIPENVTSIGANAFSECWALTELKLPSRLETIEENAFSWCKSLAKVVIPENVTSIGANAFYNCAALTEVKLPTSLKIIGEKAFSCCKSLSKIVIPEGVTSIDNYAFSKCSSLTEITLPKSLYVLGNYAFSECSSLTEVTLPKSPTVFGRKVFAFCPSLSTPIVRNPFEPERQMEYVTNGFDIVNDVLSGISFRRLSPYYDHEITLVVPASVKKIAPSAFFYADTSFIARRAASFSSILFKSIVSIQLPKSVKEISSDAFGEHCTFPSLRSIEVDPKNPCYQSIDGVLYNKAGDTLIRCPYAITSLHIPEGVTTIAESAFHDCSLAEVTLPQSLKTIEAHAFEDCNYLTKLVIPEGVTSIGENAFMASCLTEITLPKGLKAIEAHAFKGCTYLKKIVIPEGVTSIGKEAFRGCIALAEVTLPSNLKTIESEAFVYCSSLQKLVIPEGVTSIGEHAFYSSGLIDLTLLCAGLSTFAKAFESCEHLSRVTLPDGLRMIDTHAFYLCKSLESIVLPNSIKEIAYGAFASCERLTSIALPEGLTKLNGFARCISLTEISIPESVSMIGESAFGSCTALKHITMHTAQGQYFANMLRPSGFNPKADPPIVHIEDITVLTAKYRVYAAIGFALDHRDCTDENGKKYLKYIKANAAKLASAAVEYRELFDLMLREQLIAAKDLEAFSAVIQASGQADLIAALQAYAEQLPAPKKRKQ